ncbi:response regulator transcription factor [Pusillimonas noertemannii]|uniref:DNA-binding response OmpR family regulator n=1 Tax=Pusillimonas noertemannii TaxID=305977 RepID=A0A2U1CSD1_9BURK|nr:response regulator transcription factor [Pusillimonas noertemannii]NYT68130.1 response regulator transcription factor [Pusillimonas noertemannii]PVY68807.1 DNA-binding response OmpR family regulator [Pusillimonas noertemannii]TFL11739.1 response regulator transcription factor [Pusillimonas noertemannii]
MNIASLEDDVDQAELIRHILTEAGHECASFHTGKALLDVLRKHQPFDLMLIDWEIPDITGIEVVRWVRTHVGYDLPLMFVTSRTLEKDLVAGLQAGADDYITKPVRFGELIARVDALLRRRAVEAIKEQPMLQLGRYVLDETNYTACLDGENIVLAPKEFELAVLFFRNPGRLFSRDVLSAAVWNREIPATSRTLDTHLSNIRQKLRLRPENGVRLASSYALGYRLEIISEAEGGPQ